MRPTSICEVGLIPLALRSASLFQKIVLDFPNFRLANQVQPHNNHRAFAHFLSAWFFLSSTDYVFFLLFLSFYLLYIDFFCEIGKKNIWISSKKNFKDKCKSFLHNFVWPKQPLLKLKAITALISFKIQSLLCFFRFDCKFVPQFFFFFHIEI